MYIYYVRNIKITFEIIFKEISIIKIKDNKNKKIKYDINVKIIFKAW